MYNPFNFYAGSEEAVTAGVFSTHQMEKPTGCVSAWIRVILSGFISVSTIVALFSIFLQQFAALKGGRKLQRDRDSAIDAFLPNETTATKRSRFPNYGKDVFEQTSAFYWGAEKTFAYYWWAPRLIFLLMLSAVSVAILLYCSRLIC